jgi:DNA-binding CsgD family transcriptional regulator/tetratricopeptide (TPR) repeat protein
MPGKGPLVGRDEELRAVMGALDSRAPLVYVAGDAGIGKSRLVARAVESARAAGFTVLVGGCVSLAQKLPLLPFVQALSGMSEEDLSAAVGRMPAPLAVAASALLQRDVGPLSGQDAGEQAVLSELGAWEREKLVLAVEALLSPPARTDATVVVIEDAQWADPFTLDLLSYLVAGRSTGATFIVTVRTDEWPSADRILEVMAELQRFEGVLTVELGPLSVPMTAALVSGAVGGLLPQELVDQIVELSGGNPFFAEQLCMNAKNPSDAGWSDMDPGSLSSHLAGFLLTRVRRVTEQARWALLVLGVAGLPLSEEELTAAADLAPGVTAEVVRELSDAALVAAVGRGRLEPKHALLAVAAAQASDPLTVARSHAAVAALLEAAGDRERAVAAAGHWAAAGRDRDELRATPRAAVAAEGMADFALAARMWERVFRLAQRYPDEAAEHGLSPLYSAVAALQCLDWAGQTERAIDLAHDALTVLTPLEESPLGGVFRMWVGRLESFRNLAGGAAVLRDAVRVLSRYEPSPALALALSYLGRIEARQRRPEIARELLENAISAGHECGARHAEVAAVVSLGHLLVQDDRFEEAVSRTRELATRADIAVDARAYGLLATFESDLLLRTSRLEQGRDVAQAAFERLRQEGYGRTFDASVLRYNAGEAELEMGRSRHAMALVEAGTTGREPEIHTTGDHVLRALADLNIGAIEHALARIESVSAVSRATNSAEDIRLTGQAAAFILRWAGHPERGLAGALIDLELLTGTDEQSRTSELFTAGAAAAADSVAIAYARGDDEGRRSAERDLHILEGLVETFVPSPFTQSLDGGREVADEAQWKAELSRAALASDPLLWTAAAEHWEAQARPHRAAYCWWRCAQAKVALGVPVPEIASAIHRAYELSVEMQPLRGAIIEIAGPSHISLTTRPVAAPRRTLSPPVPLTERELEVLSHIAAGRSNGQIAADLFISPKTVSVHVSNLLRKIGVENRVQAAAWAEQVGVLDRG